MSFSDAALVALRPELLAYCRSLVRRSAFRAEDICQGALERALTFRAKFRPGTNLRAWLFTIARNYSRAERRLRRNREHNLFEDYDAEGFDCPQDFALDLKDALGALSRLSPRHQSILKTLALEDPTYADLAAREGVCIGTIKSRISRARRSLRKELDATRPD